jgi:hypothetical protein
MNAYLNYIIDVKNNTKGKVVQVTRKQNFRSSLLLDGPKKSEVFKEVLTLIL